MKNEGIRISNSVFSMDSYYSSFIYYAVFPISNEIPPEVKRDYRLLENEYN
ncbi:MAG: hypothetical protein LBF15_01920 [Candidatus Peribacteria bacterium]|jgi:hypothetical protein|nr:hypothetical protein [Candidatus Peribacteria bacterium]